MSRLAKLAGILAFVLITTHLAALPAPAAAQSTGVVEEIVVEGTQRIEPGTVRSYLLIREGDAFDAGRIDRSLKSLFATGLFADVSISQEGDRLIVRVVENPVINRIAFEGNSRIDDETLQSEISLRPRVIFTRTKVQSDVRRILTLYRRSGRFSATVDPKVIQLEQNRVDVAFEINEGPVTLVEKIRFVGNKEFSDSKLRSVIRTKEEAWWRFLSSDDTYDPDRLSLDRELLRRFYLSEGYADFQVDGAVAELTPNREAFFITFTVDEGDRYKFGGVEIESTLRGLQTETLAQSLEIEPGDWYNADEVDQSIDLLTEEVGNQGYAFVDIRPRVNRDREKRDIDLVFEIAEGPRVFVERIDITGNVRTLDEVIRREFRLVEGDAFNASKLRRSRQRIQNLDYFETVSVEEVPGSAPDKAIIKTKVEEKSTGALSIGAGFSTASGALADLSLTERNLLGRGQSIRASLLIGQRDQQVDLSFTEPYFLDREVSAGFDLFRIKSDRKSESSFKSTTTGGNLRANYPITEHLSQNWRYSLRDERVGSVSDNASQVIKNSEGSDLVSEISAGLIYDRRDNRLNPTKGYFVKSNIDVAGLGGDVAYIRNRMDAGYFYPVADEWILALNLAGGHVNGLGEDPRLLDRYFIGGDDVRGFATDGIGPRDEDTDDALGGQLFYSGTVQLAFPLGLPDELALRGRVFSDFGSLWEISQDTSCCRVGDSSNPRASVGVGVTWVSPFGPIGVDLAQALIKESFDKTEIFRVNFGTSF